MRQASRGKSPGRGRKILDGGQTFRFSTNPEAAEMAEVIAVQPPGGSSDRRVKYDPRSFRDPLFRELLHRGREHLLHRSDVAAGDGVLVAAAIGPNRGRQAAEGGGAGVDACLVAAVGGRGGGGARGVVVVRGGAGGGFRAPERW